MTTIIARDDQGRTLYDIVREVFPDATNDLANWILWEQTPFPLVVDGDTLISGYLQPLRNEGYGCPRCGKRLGIPFVLGERYARDVCDPCGEALVAESGADT